MKKCLCSLIVILCMVLTMVCDVSAAKGKEKDKPFYVNMNGVEMSKKDYLKAKKFFCDDTIKTLTKEQFEVVKDEEFTAVDSETKYFLTEYVENEDGGYETFETECSEEEALQYVQTQEQNVSLCEIPTHTTAMKKITIGTYAGAANTKIATVTNEWLSLPQVRSYDVIAVRFTSLSALSILKANNATSGYQTWDGNTINYDSNGSNITIKTSNCNAGKAGVGIKMNIKDEVSRSLKMGLTVTYTRQGSNSYFVYGTYQHATENLSDVKYSFSPVGMGNVLDLGSYASKYDNTSGVHVLGK